jgi:hypothetical protein
LVPQWRELLDIEGKDGRIPPHDGRATRGGRFALRSPFEHALLAERRDRWRAIKSATA